MSPPSGPRDGYGHDLPPRPSHSHSRARSRSPPPPRPYPPPARVSRDHDAAPKLLQKKSVTASNSIPLNPAGSHSHSYAAPAPSASVASSSSSIHDRVPPPARSSDSFAEAPAELLARLKASQPERSLFDQIELKRYDITEDRRDLFEQRKKLKTLQDYVNKTANKDPKTIAKLTEQQQAVLALEQKINAAMDALYVLHIQWQLALTNHIVTAAVSPVDSKYDELDKRYRSAHGEVTKIRIDVHKAKNDMDKLGEHVAKLKQDVVTVKADASLDAKRVDRISKELSDTSKDLRKDLNQDVVQITDNQRRIKRLERDLDAIHAKLPKSSSSSSSSNAVSQRTIVVSPAPAATTSTAPASPRSAWDRSDPPVTDPHPRPALPPASADIASASKTASNIAATSEPATKSGQTAPETSAPGSKPVTQAQFRKWDRDLKQDLELRFDEVLDRAVQEATAENHACMEERLQALARKWKYRVTKGGDTSIQQPPAGTAGPAPMELDAVETQNLTAGTAASTQLAQDAQTAGAVPSHAGPSSPARSAADSDIIEIVTPPNGASQNGKGSTSTPAEPGASEPGASAGGAAAGDGTSSSAAQPTSTTASAPSEAQPTKSPSAEGGTAKAKMVSIPAQVLHGIRIALKDNGQQIDTIKREVAELHSAEGELFEKLFEKLLDKLYIRLFDKLLTSQDLLERLYAALTERTGLGGQHEAFRQAGQQLQTQVVKLQTEMETLRRLQQVTGVEVQSNKEWRQEFSVYAKQRLDELAKQHEALDDQTSLQGALLVKLSEHANPRRAPSAQQAVSDGRVQSPAVRSPLVQQAQAQAQQLQRPHHLPPQPQPQQLVSPMSAPRPSLDAAVGISPHQLQQQQQQMQQLQQHYQQVVQHPNPGYNTAPSAPYPYQDPNHLQGFS